jgi:hypothetical protein
MRPRGELLKRELQYSPQLGLGFLVERRESCGSNLPRLHAVNLNLKDEM